MLLEFCHNKNETLDNCYVCINGDAIVIKMWNSLYSTRKIIANKVYFIQFNFCGFVPELHSWSAFQGSNHTGYV